MPAHALQHFGTDDPRIAIPLNKARRYPIDPISPRTVNAKYLSALKGSSNSVSRPAAKLIAAIPLEPSANTAPVVEALVINPRFREPFWLASRK